MMSQAQQQEQPQALPPPAEQQQLLLELLESMPSAEHERFLGEKLHSFVQVHILST